MSGAADDNTERVDRVDESEGDLQSASEVEGQPAVDGDASGSTAPPAPDANGAERTPKSFGRVRRRCENSVTP